MTRDKDGRFADDGVDQWLGKRVGERERGELEPTFKLGNGNNRPDPSSPDGVLIPQSETLGFEMNSDPERMKGEGSPVVSGIDRSKEGGDITALFVYSEGEYCPTSLREFVIVKLTRRGREIFDKGKHTYMRGGVIKGNEVLIQLGDLIRIFGKDINKAELFENHEIHFKKPKTGKGNNEP